MIKIAKKKWDTFFIRMCKRDDAIADQLVLAIVSLVAFLSNPYVGGVIVLLTSFLFYKRGGKESLIEYVRAMLFTYSTALFSIVIAAGVSLFLIAITAILSVLV